MACVLLPSLRRIGSGTVRVRIRVRRLQLQLLSGVWSKAMTQPRARLSREGLVLVLQRSAPGQYDKHDLNTLADYAQWCAEDALAYRDALERMVNFPTVRIELCSVQANHCAWCNGHVPEHHNDCPIAQAREG